KRGPFNLDGVLRTRDLRPRVSFRVDRVHSPRTDDEVVNVCTACADGYRVNHVPISSKTFFEICTNKFFSCRALEPGLVHAGIAKALHDLRMSMIHTSGEFNGFLMGGFARSVYSEVNVVVLGALANDLETCFTRNPIVEECGNELNCTFLNFKVARVGIRFYPSDSLITIRVLHVET